MKLYIKNKKAFTLAEVLITLGIIGVVAAMTIPNLIAGQQERATVTAVKKAYSALSSAYALAIEENGTPDYWEIGEMGDATGLDNINKIMSKYLNIQKNCGRQTGCFPDVKYKDLNGLETTSIPNQSGGTTKFILADGTSLAITQWSGNCVWSWSSGPILKNICGNLSVDINGFKKPNQIGVDRFSFAFTKRGLVPVGIEPQTSYTFANYCNLDKSSAADWNNGSSCTAWVVYKGNLDYTKCGGLSWTGKTKCD